MRSLEEHLHAPSLGVPPDGVDADGCAGGSCGVLASFWIDVDQSGTIVDCAARVRGRAAAFAAASALCEAAIGRTVLDAASLGLTSLHPSFAELEDSDRERALVVEDGFHHALGRWLRARMRPEVPGVGADRPGLEPVLPTHARPAAVVGMSGGVNSAVALHRTIAEQPAVVGVTLRMWIDPAAPDPDAACCSPDSVRRARATCHEAGVPHVSIDLRKSFAREVIVPFASAYARGMTPNPCVRCNGRFRLDELVRLADVLGATDVVTGHYARIVERGGRRLVARGLDPNKDQSYMLSAVDPATTARLRFPLGQDDKRDVRSEAARLGLEQADTPDSQELCFLGGGDYRRFLRRAGALGPAGRIVLDDGSGTVLGRHDGIARFTPGQRRGIGVAHPTPLYVHDVDPDDGTVLVGDGSSLERRDIELDELRWHVAEPPSRVHVQLRHRARGDAPAGTVEARDAAGRACVVLDRPQRAPAPGQAIVLYDEGGAVVGVGRILRVPALAGARRSR